MLESVLRTQCGLDPQQPVLAGVSGGPDSLCLLDVLRAAGYRVIVAHFNHRLRPEADIEAASVSERARSLGLVFVTDAADVGAHAQANGLSVEEAARLLRYRFLFAAARTHGAQAVAVGHTADDQVETVLMHFLRGAGLSGLKGMEHRTLLPVFDARIPLIRPLLSLWRTDTEAYCRAHELQPHFDLTNTDQAYFRNRLRHTLIPELEKYNPRFKVALLHTASALQGDFAALQSVLDTAWNEVLTGSGEGWYAFDQARLAMLTPGLRRNLIRRAAELLRPDSRDIGFDALERAAAFVETRAGKQVDLINGLYLIAENGVVLLAGYETDLPSAQWPQVERQAAISDQRLELGNGWVLTAAYCTLTADNLVLNTDPYTAWLDVDTLKAGGLQVRPRRAGDRFAPFGLDGQTVKIQDFFVNAKLPRRAREKWPLVYAGEQIVWVPGFRIAQPCRVTEKTKKVVKLSLKKT